MGDQNTIEKVYDMKMLGGQQTYETLAGINKMFEQIKANKTSLNGIFNINVDTSKLGVLDSSIAKLINEIKVLTAGMKDLGQVGSKMAADIAAAMAKLNMATIPNIVGFREFQASMNPGNIDSYVRAAGSLGAKLAFLKEQATNTSQSLKLLGEEYKDSKISEQEYEQETARLTTELQILKTQATEVAAAMTAMNKLRNPGLTEEETKTLAANRLELQQRNQMLKMQAIAEDAAAGSRDAARAKISELQKELGALNVTTDEHIAKILETDLATDADIAKQKELIETLDLLHGFVRENSDAFTKQKINIGNYPQLKTEFADLKQQMIELILAGKADSAEFQALQQQALKMAASMKEVEIAMKQVNAAVKETASVGDKFINIVEKMGLRMAANLIIFQAAIEVGQYLWEQWTKETKAVEEYQDALKKASDSVYANSSAEQEHARILVAIATDNHTAMNLRVEAVQKLQSEYPNYLGNLSQEAILTGKVTEQMEALNKALLNKALMEANIEKVKLAAKRYSDIQDDIDKQQKKLDDANTKFDQLNASKSTNQYAISAKTRAALDAENAKNEIKSLRERQQTYREEMAKYSKLAEQFGVDAAGVLVDPKKEKKEKQAHDYTNALLEAQKKLTDNTAKEAELRIQIEMAEQRAISDNLEKSLAGRLKAYAIYARDQKQLLELQSAAAIKDVQDRLDKIAEIEKKPADKRTVEENTLLINKPQLLKQIDVLHQEYKLKQENAAREITAGIISISKTSIDQMLAEIDRGVKEELTKTTDRITQAKQSIEGRNIPKERKDRLENTLDLQNNVDVDKTNILANQKKIDEVQEELDIATKAKDLEREKAFQDKLTELQSQGAQLRAKMQQDEKALQRDGLQDSDLIQREIVTQSFSAIQKISESYLQSMQQIDAYREEMAQRQLSWNEKLLNSQVQSNQQKAANDKAMHLAEQALSKQKAEDQKKRAISQAIINEGLAATQIIVNTLMSPTAKAMPDGGLTLALIQETASLAAFSAQIAELSSVQTFGSGGEVPSNGGIFGGRSHTAGGTPFFWRGGRFEAEAGEISIINKRSAASNQNMTVSGTPKQIASAVNAYGGGIDFAPGASLYRFEWGGSMGAQLQPPSFIATDYTRNYENRQQIGDMHSAILEIAKSQQTNIELLHSRIDNIKVSLDHRDVSQAQDINHKKVSVGIFGGKK